MESPRQYEIIIQGHEKGIYVHIDQAPTTTQTMVVFQDRNGTVQGKFMLNKMPAGRCGRNAA